MNSGLAVRICPSHLSVRLNFQPAIRQRNRLKLQQRSRKLRFRREHVHAGFAQVQKNAFDFPRVGQRQLHRSLHRNPETLSAARDSTKPQPAT